MELVARETYTNLTHPCVGGSPQAGKNADLSRFGPHELGIGSRGKAKNAAEVAIIGAAIPRRHAFLGGLKLYSADGLLIVPDIDSQDILA